ncbi:sensor histidine kinase [Limnohabitans sp. 63ED37-2]|uniref:sensor histidine kinase n=1 Tax=Limnohabitans sp. 63ED37-2 TaxID=1678128 RepID=UPI000706B291|nr:ATP-binding protein [Limnohabitans sp. 63ED37-2]ALK87442.1 Sensor protein FixL [Limnohabitans sp. 63ED37-2]
MPLLHLPTAYFIAGILYLAMPLFVWAILRNQNERINTLWCLGGVSFGLSLVLLGMRGKVPDVLTYGIAVWLLVVGPLLRAGALRIQLQKPLYLMGILSLSFMFFAVYALFDLVLNNDTLPFIWSNLGAGAAVGWLAFGAHNVYRLDRSISARWMFLAYLTLSVLLGLRVLSLLLGSAQPQAMAADPLSVMLIVWAVVTSIVGNVGFLGIFTERMNRKALELAKVQARQEEAARLIEQVAQLDRRRSVGEIAASLAHELSQPLTNIYLIADRMEMSLQERQDESLNKYFEDLNRNTQKAGDILGRIRSFIQSRAKALERIELSQVITDAKALIHNLAHNESVDIQISLHPQELAVRADPVQLSQIFMNVLRNAIQATQGQASRQLQIRVWREEQMAHITFTDNGPGLSAEVLRQVGTSFFSTKSEGLGVGLSISKSIAQQHGGNLTIGNSPLGGAVVELQLPVMD